MLRYCLTTSGVVRSPDPYRHAARNFQYVVLHCCNCADMLYEHSTAHRCAAQLFNNIQYCLFPV